MSISSSSPPCFWGLAVGQLIYGPVSDSIGRKPAIHIGLALFLAGCVMSIASSTYAAMLAGRVLQGLGVAGPRIVTVALVRDRYEGRAMARIMSLIMMTFIIVPAVAPAIGQGILMAAHWRMIFVFFLALGVIAMVWFGLRQEETLRPEARRPLSLRHLASGVRETLSNRHAFGYAVAGGLVFGPFIGYLTSAQQILQKQFGLGELFPAYFAVLALAVGAASYFNARLVMRLGMRHLSRRAAQTLAVFFRRLFRRRFRFRRGAAAVDDDGRGAASRFSASESCSPTSTPWRWSLWATSRASGPP